MATNRTTAPVHPLSLEALDAVLLGDARRSEVALGAVQQKACRIGAEAELRALARDLLALGCYLDLERQSPTASRRVVRIVEALWPRLFQELAATAAGAPPAHAQQQFREHGQQTLSTQRGIERPNAAGVGLRARPRPRKK